MASPQERKFAFSYLERGKEFAAAKQYPEALEALREAVRRDPSMVEAWMLLASVHYTLGEDIEGHGATEEALKHQGNSGAAWNARGLALERLKRYEDALGAYAHAMQIDGWFAVAAQNACNVLLYLERYDEALRVADALLAEQSGNGRFWALRSAAVRCLQQYEEAYQAAKEAARLAPQDGYAWFQLSAALSRLGRYNEALEASDRELALRGVSSDFWWLRAYILGGKRRFEEALIASQEALAFDGQSSHNRNRAGISLLNLGRPAEAYEQFNYAAKLNTHDPAYPTNAGVALYHLRRYEGALACSDKALALRPDFVSAATNRAECLVQLGRYGEADTQLANASEDVAAHSEYWAVKGSLYTHRREYDAALAAIKRAIDLSEHDGNTAVAWERMGELLIALEGHAKALEVAEHGLTLRPHRFSLQQLMAKALRGLGRDNEAEEIERAVEVRLAEQLALLDQMEGTSE